MKKLLFLLLASALLTYGCGGRSPATSYYILESGAEAPLKTNLAGKKEISLYKVEIPAYLDRNSIVTRDQGGVKLTLAEYHQWAEPLDKGVKRVLIETMAPAMLKNGILLLDTDDNSSSSLRIFIEIQRFDGFLGGNATLDASFAVRDRDDKVLARGFIAEKTSVGQTYDSLVAAQSSLLTKLGNNLEPLILSVFPDKNKKKARDDSKISKPDIDI